MGVRNQFEERTWGDVLNQIGGMLNDLEERAELLRGLCTEPFQEDWCTERLGGSAYRGCAKPTRTERRRGEEEEEEGEEEKEKRRRRKEKKRNEEGRKEMKG